MESGFRASVSAECFQHHGHSHQDHHHDDTGGDDKSASGRHPSNVLHPVVDLDTGEIGEALLADLPHGRLGVAHRVGVLDPSTGQLLAPSTSDRSDGGMEVFAASNDVFFSAFHQEFERVLGASEPASGAYVHEAHSHSHSHSHGHHHSHSHNEFTMSQVSGITEDEEAGRVSANDVLSHLPHDTVPAVPDDMPDMPSMKWEKQVGPLGSAWRNVLKNLILLRNDKVNALMYSRGLQLDLPYLTGYESHILGLVIKAFDECSNCAEGNDKDMEKNKERCLEIILCRALKNRNVSRILVVNMTRFDLLWHWDFQHQKNRAWDIWSGVPFVGFGGLPATENFPDTASHSLNSIGRVILGQGYWWTRIITNREGLLVDDKNASAQNLAAETNGFEAANRNQFGTYFGRKHVNQFRIEHRLTTDESIVRTFFATPASTLVNNGVEHVLRAVAKHWQNILYQPSGNFAHQRMEQIDPFETLRFHLPLVLTHLVNLRGLNKWDSQVLSPFVRKLQRIAPMDDLEPLRDIIRECKENIVHSTCGGIPSRERPFRDWLDAISSATVTFEEEAKQVEALVSSIEVGLTLGTEITNRVDWSIPSPEVIGEEIKKCVLGVHDHKEGITCLLIVRALNYGRALDILTPRDKRTLASLIEDDMVDTKPAKLLLARAITLLGREIRRDRMSDMLSALSKGEKIAGEGMEDKLVVGALYRIPDYGGVPRVYKYVGRAKETGDDQRAFKFVDILSGQDRVIVEGTDRVFKYIPVAEAIVRAQKAFMTIETRHGKKFSYNAFMEIKRLRSKLRDLCCLSCIQCSALDDARLCYLKSIQDASITQLSVSDLVDGTTYYKYEDRQYVPFKPEDVENKQDLGRTLIVRVPPQHISIIGGGPTGLLTALHNCENSVASGGIITLNEARDAFDKGASTFERAQIVRLDARWISMLRFHLGALYEDTWIPASGETDAHLGNTLPDQGFVEITIKNLEDVLQIEVNRLASVGLLTQQSQSKMQYDPVAQNLSKLGCHLKVGDLVLRNVSPELQSMGDNAACVWKVTSLDYAEPVGFDAILPKHKYKIFDTTTKKLTSCECVEVDGDTSRIKFEVESGGGNTEMIVSDAASLPLIYAGGTKNRADPVAMTFECLAKNKDGMFAYQRISASECSDDVFQIDASNNHVIECIGKPHGSKVHMRVTTTEPYGVCCIGGLKISMIMHNFGEKRWGRGLVDDIRSHTDQNTRVVGDFTKNVSTSKIAEKMLDYLTGDKDSSDWKSHFNGICEKTVGEASPSKNSITTKLVKMLKEHKAIASGARRPYLQTRFFETGDNYYLGMELTREFDVWKDMASDALTKMVFGDESIRTKAGGALRKALYHALDRLWFSSALEVIRKGDVYNPGARAHIPQLYLIDSYRSVALKSLPTGEAFTLEDGDGIRYEVLVKRMMGDTICRDVEGNLREMSPSTRVIRGGNLTRGPDGNAESKVALASFPVGHYVNHRTFHLNSCINHSDSQFITTFVGDEQSTPHFMRYSGLTGACINAMLMNELTERALEGKPFADRIRQYSAETNWTNGEVVQRGTGSNYGEDGFLRPGLRYRHMLDYLRAKVHEHQDLEQAPELSRDWKIKFAAAIVPRGFEDNLAFIQQLRKELRSEIVVQLIDIMEEDENYKQSPTAEPFRTQMMQIASGVKGENQTIEDSSAFWREFKDTADGHHKLKLEDDVMSSFSDHIGVAEALEKLLEDIISYAQGAHERNERFSGELFNRPKPVDWIIDDFAVEAQNFTDTLTLVATLAAASLSWQLTGVFKNFNLNPAVGSAIISAIIPFIAFGSITNGSRYKSRNEEAREEFYDEQMLPMLMEVFSCLTARERSDVPLEKNAYVMMLEEQISRFEDTIQYYGEEEPTELRAEFETMKGKGSIESIQPLKDLLARHLVPVKYQENSYVQQELRSIYLTLEAIEGLACSSTMRDSTSINTSDASPALNLYEELLDFRPTFERSLQRGVIKYGFYKERAWRHQHIPAILAYFYEKICLVFCLEKSTRFVSSCMCPISIRTLYLKNQLDQLSNANSEHQHALRRRAQEFRVLYHATKESLVTSFIIVSAWISFIAAILATIGNIGRAAAPGNRGFEFVAMISAYTFGLLTPISAVLAIVYLARKEMHLVKLNVRLGKIMIDTVNSSEETKTIKSVRGICRSEQIAAAAQLVASLAAAVALPFDLAMRQDLTDYFAPKIPFSLAIGSLVLSLLTSLFRLYITQVKRYNLSPCLGEHIGKSFDAELQSLYQDFQTPMNTVEPKEVQKRRTWEFVAREFLHRWRYDTALQADRFGSILQYVQSGPTSTRKDADNGV